MSDIECQGGCACGAVRYRINGEFGSAFLCHCRRCQHLTGTGHAASFVVDRDKVELTGDLSTYGDKADSGFDVVHRFCGTCGAPIWGTTTRMPGRVFIFAGSLDDPSVFEPKQVVYREAAPPWDRTGLTPLD